MRIALVACVALALSNGPIGTLLIIRRESLEGNVLSHAVMPGAALGFLYAGYSLAVLTLGGLLAGLAVAGLTALTARSRLQRQDSPLIAFYLVSLSFGVLVVAARGSQTDLMHVLFGTVLAVDVKALLLIAVVSSVTMLMVATFYRPLVVEILRPGVPARGRRWRRSISCHFHYAGGSQPRREFPGFRNLARDRADVVTCCGCALLDAQGLADGRSCDDNRNGFGRCRPSCFLLCEFAFRSGNRGQCGSYLRLIAAGGRSCATSAQQT